MKAKDWKKWAKCAGIRAIKTVAQTAIATIGTVTVLGQIDTKLVISTSMLAGILSLPALLPAQKYSINIIKHYKYHQQHQ